MSHERNIVRMPLQQRLQHWILITTFTLLVLTGLPMIFDPSPLLKSILSRGDFFHLRGLVHRIAAVGMMGLCFYHLLYIILSERGNRDFRALLPGMKDARDAVGTLAWQSGISRALRLTKGGRAFQERWAAWLPAEHPRYGRYTFIEKFEYLALVWGTLLMVGSGLMLWFEEATMALFPRYVFDFVRVIHSYEAILAFLAIIVWHMYQVHLRPGAFPMNRTWLDGKTSLAEIEEEHPLEYEELLARAGGDVDTVVASFPSTEERTARRQEPTSGTPARMGS
jgi:cytochrome b subunit of formate dehydrogenase